VRRLEIGPGPERLPGYETLNALRTPFTDHVGDARRPPFQNETFDEVYSSHCIEHIEWFEIEATIKEWVRILKPGGVLEIHTVNAAPIMRAMLEWEETGHTDRKPGAWKREWHKDHPFVAGAGRILCYSKKGDQGVNMHRAILTPRYLRECFEKAGLVEIEEVAEPKGAKKHTAINMGLRGRKP
jgi:ubiquinone/menaquinone biosynthesis C-methylase UbiE